MELHTCHEGARERQPLASRAAGLPWPRTNSAFSVPPAAERLAQLDTSSSFPVWRALLSGRRNVVVISTPGPRAFLALSLLVFPSSSSRPSFADTPRLQLQSLVNSKPTHKMFAKTVIATAALAATVSAQGMSSCWVSLTPTSMSKRTPLTLSPV